MICKSFELSPATVKVLSKTTGALPVGLPPPSSSPPPPPQAVNTKALENSKALNNL